MNIPPQWLVESLVRRYFRGIEADSCRGPEGTWLGQGELPIARYGPILFTSLRFMVGRQSIYWESLLSVETPPTKVGCVGIRLTTDDDGECFIEIADEPSPLSTRLSLSLLMVLRQLLS